MSFKNLDSWRDLNVISFQRSDVVFHLLNIYTFNIILFVYIIEGNDMVGEIGRSTIMNDFYFDKIRVTRDISIEHR